MSEIATTETFSVGKYDQRVKDLAFVHYVLMDRNSRSASRSLNEVWDEDLGPVPPTPRTIARWAREDNWSYKADVEMSKNYPALFQRDVARLIALRGRAISAYSKIMEGEQMPNAMATAQVARHLLELTVGGLAVQAPRGADGETDRSMETKDLVSRQRERLEAQRG